MKAFITLIIAIVFTGHHAEGQKVDQQKLREEMNAFILSYGKAVESMDVARTQEHFADDPEFVVVADGTLFDSEAMKTLVRDGFYQGLKKVELQWDTLVVKVLNANQAVAYFKITQSLTDINSKEFKVNAEATFIARKNNDVWKIVYGHANHKAVK